MLVEFQLMTTVDLRQVNGFHMVQQELLQAPSFFLSDGGGVHLQVLTPRKVKQMEEISGQLRITL